MKSALVPIIVLGIPLWKTWRMAQDGDPKALLWGGLLLLVSSIWLAFEQVGLEIMQARGELPRKED